METVTLVCKICGRPCLKDAIVSAVEIEEPDFAPYAICPQCYNHCGTCAMCVFVKECAFETDPNPLPKQVQKTIRQGQMIMQTIVQNPDRIRETCQKSCKCWSDDLGCLKQNGTCGNYKEILNA